MMRKSSLIRLIISEALTSVNDPSAEEPQTMLESLGDSLAVMSMIT